MPFFVMPPAPVIRPLNVVSVLLPPPVSLPEPSEIVPAPAKDPTMSSNEPRLSVASALTLTAELSLILFAAPSASVPAEMVVAPVYVLVEPPANVRVPGPVLVNAGVGVTAAPEMTPDMVPVLTSATFTVEAALIVTAPLSVPLSEKLIAPDDATPVPAMVNGSDEFNVPDPATSRTAPEAMVVVPESAPSAADVVTTTVPASIVVAPV